MWCGILAFKSETDFRDFFTIVYYAIFKIIKGKDISPVKKALK
jgi:hypothetical protein